MEPNSLTLALHNFIGAFGAAWLNLLPSINWLVGTLLAIELILLGLWWALGGGERIVEVFKKILFLGFWMWIVTEFPALTDAFVQSLIRSGELAGGGAGPGIFNPSEIARYGLEATQPLVIRLDNIKWDFVDAIVIGLSYLMIMITFFIIAWQVFYAVLEYYLIVAVSGILLPFGFLKHTRFLAEKVIGAVIASGIKLMVLAFIIAVTGPILANIQFAGVEVTFNEIWSMFLTTGAIALLAWNAPGIVAGLLSGSPSLSAAVGLQNSLAGGAAMSAATARMVNTTKAAATAGGTLALGTAKAAGIMSGGSTSAYQKAIANGAGPVRAAMSAIPAAPASLVRSSVHSATSPAKTALSNSYQSGLRLGHQAADGTLSSAPIPQPSKPQGPSERPPWFNKVMNNPSDRWVQTPMEAKPHGGSAQPKI